MDDDDADYMQGSDDEVCTRKLSSPLSIDPAFYQDYGFDYSDDGEGEAAESADVENMYYTAKCTPIPPHRCHILISTDSKEGR